MQVIAFQRLLNWLGPLKVYRYVGTISLGLGTDWIGVRWAGRLPAFALTSW